MKKAAQPTNRASMRRFIKEQEKKANPPVYFQMNPEGNRSTRRGAINHSEMKHSNPKLQKGMKKHRQVIETKSGISRIVYKLRLLRNHINMSKITLPRMVYSQS